MPNIGREKEWRRGGQQFANHGKIVERPLQPIAQRRRSLAARVKAWERQVTASEPPLRQCKHLIARMGGIMVFSVAVSVYPQVIIDDWLNKTGMVPINRLFLLIKNARYFGVLLRASDIYPDFITGDEAKANCDALAWINNSGLNRKCRQQKLLEHNIASLG